MRYLAEETDPAPDLTYYVMQDEPEPEPMPVPAHPGTAERLKAILRSFPTHTARIATRR